MPLTYDAMRMMALRAALLDFFRRWGIYCAIALLVFSAGSNAPFAIAAAATAALVWPLRQAAESGWAIVPAAAGYALVGALPVALSRPLWWPRRWALAERALPLSPATLRRSDTRFAMLTMAPWQALLALGTIGVCLGGAAGDPARRWVAAGAWLLSTVGSLALATRWMRHVRGTSAPRRTGRPAVDATRRSRVDDVAARASAPPSWAPTVNDATPAPSAMPVPSATPARGGPRLHSTIASLGAARALVLLPVLRGRAHRTACILVAAAVAIVVAANGTAWSDLSIAWSLAMLALASLAATSALESGTARELRPLWVTHRAWPIDRRACERARFALILLPAFGSLAAGLCAVAAVPSASIRAGALVAWCASIAIGCTIEAATPATMNAQDRAARWLLFLATTVACGSEILTT